MSERKQLGELQAEVLSSIAQGATLSEISSELGLSEHTVQLVVRSVIKKLGAGNLAHAVILHVDSRDQNNEVDPVG